MPLGVVTDEEFNGELARIGIIVDVTRGRGHKAETPEVIREIIAEEAVIGDSTQKEIAEQFGVSPSSVSAYKNGATSTATYNEPHAPLKNHIDVLRDTIITSARSRLLTALGHITPDKLADAKVRDLSGVAKDMAVVIKSMEPEVKIEDKPNVPQFVFFAPQIMQENNFETIYAKE